MDPLLAPLRRERAVRAFLPLFFVSGATSLVYQTVWARQLHLVFGTSSFAITTVLAAFMAGLGLGGLVMARYADRIARPLRVYALLEAVIGAYAVAFPGIVALLSPLYLGAARQLELGPVGFGGVQLVLIGAALLLPTAAMGATLPLLARFAVHRLGAAGGRIGLLYGVNTAGAVFGTWAAGFVLLPGVGLWRTTVLAAAANGILAVLAAVLDRGSGGVPLTARDDLTGPRPALLVPVCAVMAIAGFSSLAYEVAWTRLLGLLLGPSAYAFSIMLLALLVGLALGGALGGPVADRALERWGTRGALSLLAAIELGVAATAWGVLVVAGELPYAYVWMFDALGAGARPEAMWVVSSLTAGVVMTPPALLMGAAFPAAVRAVVRDAGALGGPVGAVYGANTLGGVLGAVVAGFALLPGVGVAGAIYVAVLGNLLAAVVLVSLGGRSRGAAGLAAVALVLAVVARDPPWDRALMTSGMYHYVSHFEDHSRAGIDRFGVRSYDLLFYEEGLATVLTVGRNHESGHVWMAHNGKVEASAGGDLPTQILCGLLPLQFAESPRDVLVIGLASGITAGAVARSTEVQRLEIAEIEPNTAAAARFFDPWSYGVLDDPRTELVLNDGRNHLLLAPPASYDLVVNEPSNPWISGVSNLFTAEFFALGKERLRPDGVWVQWVQTYGMAAVDVRSLLGTFADAYGHVLVYATADRADLLIVGSDAPLVLDRAHMARLFTTPELRGALEDIEIRDDLELLARFQMDRDAVVRMVGDVPRNTDDNMRIEYAAPRTVHTNTSLQNRRMLDEHAFVPVDAVDRDPLAVAELGRAYHAQDDPKRAVAAMTWAARRVDEPMRSELVAELASWAVE